MKLFLILLPVVMIFFQLQAQNNSATVFGTTSEEIMNSTMKLAQSLSSKEQGELMKSVWLISNYYDAKSEEIEKYGLENGFSRSEIDNLEVGILFLGKTAPEIIRQGKECFYLVMENKKVKYLEEINEFDSRIQKLERDSTNYEKLLKFELEKINIIEKYIHVDTNNLSNDGSGDFVKTLDLTFENKTNISELKGVMFNYSIKYPNGYIYKSEKSLKVIFEDTNPNASVKISLNNSKGSPKWSANSYSWPQFEKETGCTFEYMITGTSTDGDIFQLHDYSRFLRNLRKERSRLLDEQQEGLMLNWNSLFKN